MSFQKYFKELRDNKNLTQKELAQELDISVPTIKKIEGGFTKMPSHKLLDTLSTYLDTEPRNIIRDILFYDETIYPINTPVFLQYFLSSMYIEGWNIQIGPIYKSPYLGKKFLSAFVSTRSGTLINGIVDIPNTLESYKELLIDELQIQAFITNRILEIAELEDLPNIKQIWLVFDAKKEKDIQVYNAIKRLPTRFFKVEIIIFLYDQETNIVKEKIFK